MHLNTFNLIGWNLGLNMDNKLIVPNTLILSGQIQRGLQDKLYEKRKQSALEIEKLNALT